MPSVRASILDIPVAQGEPEVEPDSVPDDIWRKSVVGIGKWASWPELLSHTPAHLFDHGRLPTVQSTGQSFAANPCDGTRRPSGIPRNFTTQKLDSVAAFRHQCREDALRIAS